MTLKPILLLVALGLTLTACNTRPPLPKEGPAVDSGTVNTAESPATGSAGMVSSAHPMATQAGVTLLEQGGNAFEAAVAVAAMLNVVEPNMSGVGGYGTILVYDAESGQTRFLNASGRIPQGVDSDVFRAPTPGYMDNRHGPKAVSTPGNANAWQAMLDAYGSLSGEQVFDAAIRTADEGFSISEGLAGSIASAFSAFSNYARTIYGRNGRPLSAGDTLVQKDLAATLRTMAKQGARSIHGGNIGQAIDAAMQVASSFLTLEDLAENIAEWYPPIQITYRGHTVLTASPPSTAFPALIRLGLMSRFDVKTLGHNSTAFLHRFAEVTKHAFRTRLVYAGDPEINPPPLDTLLSEAYWQEQVDAMNLEQATVFEPPQIGVPAGMNTTHFVVADRWGNIVSATQTLGNSFGSRILVEGTGIWLNNSLAYCTFEPKGNPMDAHAGHHKLSGDVPTIILHEGKPWAALGTPGGHTIGQTVPQMVMNLIDFEMDIQQALAAPRVSFIEPDVLAVERHIDAATRQALADLGHTVQAYTRLGNAHGLTIDYDAAGAPVRFTGAADPRGEGTAQGL